ncbi:hypothetical protein PAXINDRAFT_11166 [Paxillus involutus ATCC 200175]|nr:hypothetical protein PAXINDRAFT_11166 [Paxillus involutus ATCC 200175]
MLHQDRYKELLQISKQWRYLQNKLVFGFAHDFRVKVEDDWIKGLGGAWKYSRSFVMDGNFSTKHMKLKNDNDFNLTGGSSYFTASPHYQAHLQIANDKQPKSTCHEHKAVHATQKHLMATRIRAIACARHGCFVLDNVVDFQKGE